MVNLNKCLTGPFSCLILMFILLYIVSPVDLMPEFVLGPLGLIDDMLAAFGAFSIVFRKGTGLFK